MAASSTGRPATSHPSSRRRFLRKWAPGPALLLAAAAMGYLASRSSPDFRPYWAAYWWGLVTEVRELYGPTSGIEWPMTYRSGPLFVFLFLPFAWPSLRLGAAAWAFAKVLVLRWLIGRIYRFALADVPARAPWWHYAWLPVLACGSYTFQEFRSGNMQFFVFALAAAGFCLLDRYPAWPALCFALGTGIKLFPAFFLPYLWVRGYRRVAVWFLAFLAIILLLPAVHFGLAGNWRVHGDWFVLGIADPSPWNWGINPDHSLLGVMTRYFSRMPYETMPDPNYTNINVADLPRQTLKLIWIMLAAPLYLLLLLWGRRARQAEAARPPASPRTLPLESALLFGALLLLEPLTQRIYLVALLFPATILSVELRHRLPAGRAGRFVLALTALCLALLTLPLLWSGREAQRLLAVYSPDFWATLLLAVIIAILLGRRLRTAALPASRAT